LRVSRNTTRALVAKWERPLGGYSPPIHIPHLHKKYYPTGGVVEISATLKGLKDMKAYPVVFHLMAWLLKKKVILVNGL
jgi:hypothetical protein